MRIFLTVFFLLFGFSYTFGQNEQSPIVERSVQYKNWSYTDIRTGSDIDLRKFTKGKKLVMVVYFAPWCPNWKHDAPILQRFYEKYRASGFDIIGVAEYDTVAAVNAGVDALKVSFPIVSESESRDQRQSTLHYTYRQLTGDTRKWGSPWYIFLEPQSLEKTGDELTAKTNVINGEAIEAEGDKFIRQKLGLPAEAIKTAAKTGEIEVCDPDKKTVELKKP
ncbi:MAG: redoxin domain-containing protein [Pyrinomonadaceae bacterium]